MAGSPNREADLDDYRLHAASEIQALIQRLIDERCLVSLSGPDGDAYTTLLTQADEAQRIIGFAAEDADAQLDALLEQGEIVAVAYLDKIKIQFDLEGVVQVRSPGGRILRARWPSMLYRFQRRQAFRVQPLAQQTPMAHLRHPTPPGNDVHLRVLDVSLSGVALLLPDHIPMIPAGVKLKGCRLDLDDQTSLTVTLVVHHVTTVTGHIRGVRLGCELLDNDRGDRALGQYINQTQKRRAALAVERR